MLNVAMYQGCRFFSHSGTCWTIGTSAASGGASRSAAGRRKTPVVWYESVPSLFRPRRGVTTTNSCASAAPGAKTKNASQPWRSCASPSDERAAAAIAAAPTTR